MRILLAALAVFLGYKLLASDNNVHEKTDGATKPKKPPVDKPSANSDGLTTPVVPPVNPNIKKQSMASRYFNEQLASKESSRGTALVN